MPFSHRLTLLSALACAGLVSADDTLLLPPLAPLEKPAETPARVFKIVSDAPKTKDAQPMPAHPEKAGNGHDAHGEPGKIKDVTPHGLESHGDTHTTAPHGNGGGHAAHEEEHDPGVYGWAEYMFIKPRTQGLDYAFRDPADDLVTAGRTARVSYDGRSAFRAGLGYTFCSGWSIGGGYMYLRANGNATQTADPGGVIFPTQTRAGLTDTALSATANVQLTGNLYDVQVAKSFHVDESTAFRFLTGVQFAELDQQLQVRYDGLLADGATTQNNVEFRGAGPFIGGEGVWELNHTWSLFGGGKGGLLIGDSKASLVDRNNNGLTTFANVGDRYTKTVPFTKLNLGVTYKKHTWYVRGGYEMANFFGVFDSLRLPDDFTEGRTLPRASDLSWNGFFVQLGLSF